VKPSDLELIRKGMWMAVNEAGGTAGKLKIPNVEVAAKTGTAQTSDRGKKSHNAWVVSFAPFDKPKYAVCVLVQNGGSGGGVAGPLANMIYQGIFGQENDGIRLGLSPQTEFAGNDKRYETEDMTLPENFLSTIQVIPTDDGENGDEADTTAPEAPSNSAKPTAPSPTITEEAEAEGLIPRAKPVRGRRR
jgi:penicillin-binding protein 2